MEVLNDKDNREIAEILFENAKDMDFADYEDDKEQIINDLENAIYYLKTIAKNEYNQEYFRTFYNTLQCLN